MLQLVVKCISNAKSCKNLNDVINCEIRNINTVKTREKFDIFLRCTLFILRFFYNYRNLKIKYWSFFNSKEIFFCLNSNFFSKNKTDAFMEILN